MILDHDVDRPKSTAPSEALPHYVPQIAPRQDTQELPSYSRSVRPPAPVTYTFAGWQGSSLLLMPPPTSVDLGPLYHIDVSLNLRPLDPISFITTVRRGGNGEGPFVGDFELSLNQKRGVVSVGDTRTRLSNVLFSVSGSTRHWGWSCRGVKLRWDCRTMLPDGSPMCICYLDTSMHQLATFVPPPIDASPPLPAALLTIFPDGHPHMDQILLSLLVVERKRTLMV